MTKRQVIPGVYVEPRIAETARGKVEFDLTEGDGPVVLSVHGGLGGADQGRLNADWLAGRLPARQLAFPCPPTGRAKFGSHAAPIRLSPSDPRHP